MKFFVWTDDPIVLEKVKLQGRNIIRLADDNFGAEEPFKVDGDIYTCPKCERSVYSGGERVNYCAWCGLKNEVEDESQRG